MSMKKKLFFAAIALTALASCTSDDFVGDQSLLEENGGAISFNMKTPAITRAEDKTGSSAATDLNNQFVVFGYKTMSDDSKQTVFSNYQVNYVSTSANTTTSNSAGWEYVGYKSLSANMTDNKGVTYNANHAAEAADADQTIKYWDFSASNYKFYAYSLGAGNTTSSTFANASLMSTSNTYTLQGDQDVLSTCYISELLTIADPNSTTATEVDLRFLSIMSKIQLGFYETIPGYSVKSLKFYVDKDAASSATTPALYQTTTATLPKAGTYTITFDSNGKPQLAWAAAASDGTQANIVFTSVPNTELKQREYKEVLTDPDKAETAEENMVYLGRTSNTASKTEVKNILPYADGADLTLKVDYVLVSRDKSGETIEAKGATAKIPAAFTQWKPNYKYTYLFKISENSNPLIGEVTGLYPITLDAVVADGENGSQETITTVSEPSITSYAKASAVTTDNEYKTGNNIYLVVEDGATNPELTVGSNANLYTATIEEGAAQEITEESVKNALTTTESSGTWTVTDALGKEMVVTKINTLLSVSNTILAADSPTGVDLTVNHGKFTPAVPTYAAQTPTTENPKTEGLYERSGTGLEESPYVYTLTSDTTVNGEKTYYKKTSSAGYYVFEYIKEGGKYYKVIKVVD